MVFGDRNSLFNTSWQCLNLVKGIDEDFITNAGVVNREWEKFKLNELTPNLFKSLTFVLCLTTKKDAEIRSKILAK